MGLDRNKVINCSLNVPSLDFALVSGNEQFASYFCLEKFQ